MVSKLPKHGEAKGGLLASGLEGVVIEVFIEKDKPFHVQGLPKDITLMVWNYDALGDKTKALKKVFTHEGEVK